MRIDNCEIVCREIEEADYGENLGASTIEHLGDCHYCRKFSKERSKLRKMMASLETVGPPPDFDMRVRSRLANERVGVRSGFFFGGFTFGVPSIALAAMVLVIGTVFALRAWDSTNSNMVVQTEPSESTRPRTEREQPPAREAGAQSNAENRPPATINANTGEVVRRGIKPQKRGTLRSTVASLGNSRRVVTREFSSTAAPVVKNEDTIASLESSPVFLIEASSQPLRLSLDYSGGVSRTISVPTLSFGSERVLAGDGLSLVRNAPKGAW